MSHLLFQSDNKLPARPNHLSQIMPLSLSKSKPASSEKVDVALRELLSSGEKEFIQRDKKLRNRLRPGLHPIQIRSFQTWLSNMVKTNFKCMHLVDDILYRKITHSETNLKTSVNPSTPLLNTNEHSLERWKHLNQKSSQIPNPNTSFTTSILDPDEPIPEREREVGNVTQSNPPAPLSTDKNMEQSINVSTNQEPLSEARGRDMSIDEAGEGDISPKENNEVNCACLNPIKPGKEQKRGILKAPPRKRPISQTENRDIADHEPKCIRSSPPETCITKEDEYDWDNDPEIPELRDRFRKIKYDINYPPPKEPVLRNTKKDRRRKTSTTYLCSICDTYFKYRYQLLRHISDSHPSFSQAPEKQDPTNKPPSKEETSPQKRKIKEPDPRRGVKRKSNKEKPFHKKVRTDGRQKRKSNFPDSRAGAKHRKSEIECKLCHAFLKTEKALERHEKNVHDSPRSVGTDLKRKRSNTSFSGPYVKRRKPQPRAPILYQNYF